VTPSAGLYLLHKPRGATSFSLVQEFHAEVQRAGIRRDKLPACHGGALDPFAEGLLLLLAGPATRLMELLHPIPKEYEAEVAWGVETDNGDPGGRPVRQGSADALTAAALEAALPRFLGWQEQVPPATSNKRVEGERAWVRAHRGEQVVLPPSRVYLHEARWLSHDLPRASTLRLSCRGGYYVRALARDLGRALGCPAHLRALRRTAIGPWRDPGPGARSLVQGRALLPWCPWREVSEAEERRIEAGQPIARGEVAPPEWPLPAAFPDPQAPVRALCGPRLVALLREEGASLTRAVGLGRGL
jgi:tRNA pseudouridine55 synthase